MTSLRLTLGLVFAPVGLASAASILFTGAGATPTSGADGAVFTFLQSRYGAANVDYVQSNSAAGVEVGYDVLVISSTPGSGDIRNKWHNTTVPVVNWEEAVVDNAAGEFSISLGRPKASEVDHSVVITQAHPITAGFAVNDTVQIASGNAEVFWSNGTQAPGAISLAQDDANAANGWLTIVDSGGELLNGSTAPARRVMFGITDNTFSSFTADGQQLFGQAVDWAGNISPIPEPSSLLMTALAALGFAARRRRS